MRAPITYSLTGDGPPVLLLHGLGGDRRQALGLLPGDVRATRIAPDMPGHGDTELTAEESLTFAEFAALVADLLDTLREEGKLPIKAMPVVGVSMGAGIAVALADDRPDLVERLILIRPSWLDRCPPPNLAPFPLIARLIDAFGPEAGSVAFRATPEYQSMNETAPAMADSLLGQFTRSHAAERSRVLADIPSSLPLPNRDAYHRLQVETLVVAAPDDPVHPEQLARTVSNWIPNARLVTVPRKMPDPTEHQLALQRVVAAGLAPPTPGGGRS
ncbi:alpha/beta hydrolase [Acrocarpospora macrocephala]|uniref:Esterase n=1 Tax=Acrocarpospora macrocephala TaxID=150177 RepID=A0A5M3WBS2_9ACTN|nr:alpha/beta hydrolase [Acrocarpospora macrocephala]GES06487.1 esterase [Acrocarpospora macrocephala]